MSKELFVSSTPHETKVAIVEEDQLAEIYYERENEYTLAGSIYKGRVTRVLPGMQSAFVNIGLERDAFLYVSDFLLEEEDDTDDLEHAVSRARVIESPGPEASTEHTEHVQAQNGEETAHVANGEAETEQHEEGSQEETHARAPENGGEEREGARKWRGRRRRRGRGGRFQDREDRGDRNDRGERGERERNERPAEVSSSRPETPTHAPHAHAAHEPDDEPILLPGESISKYQPHSETKPAARAAKPAPVRSARPSTEYSLDAASFSPDSMTLPGESISKYRGQSASASVPAAEFAPVPAPEQQQHAESGILEHGVQQDVESAGPIPHQHEEQQEQEEVTYEAREHRDQASHNAPSVSPFVIPAAKEPEPEEEQEEKEAGAHEAEFTHHPAVGEQAEADNQETASHAEEFDAAEETQHESQEPWRVSGSGLIEEEEIEEDESELPGYEEDADLSEFEELEEEVMGQEQIAAGRELVDALRDAHVSERTAGPFTTEGLEAEELETEETDEPGEVFGVEEESDEADEEAFAETSEGADDLEGARAEQRATANAGYQQQQRSDRRPDRRGGRRPGGRRNMRGRRHQAPRQLPAISDLLKEGQEILVQIAKEPIAKKGARITSHIALPGRFLVYMPTVHHTGVSRKIASEEERHRLKRIVISERGDAHGGFIVRTAAAGANEDDLRADIRFLINLWNEIRGRADNSKAPALIYHDLNLVERILRDQVTTSFSAVWVDTEQEYERVLRFVSRFQPSLLKRVKLYSKETPLFEQFSITEEVNKALKSKVWLKSGGYIVINQTEALVAIDVNTGKYVGKTARLEDTIVRTNIDAIREIVRQIRLRDLGGIIVIDFIDMDERKNRQKVMQALEEALKADRAPSKVLQFNDFGLVAITRKRVKQSLERTLGQPCPTCQATGMIKSVGTVCNEIYVEMRKMSRHFEHDVMLRVNPEVAKALKANAGRWVQEMEELTGHTVLVKSDPLLHPEHFDIQ
jgi:ribonuclease G